MTQNNQINSLSQTFFQKKTSDSPPTVTLASRQCALPPRILLAQQLAYLMRNNKSLSNSRRNCALRQKNQINSLSRKTHLTFAPTVTRATRQCALPPRILFAIRTAYLMRNNKSLSNSWRNCALRQKNQINSLSLTTDLRFASDCHTRFSTMRGSVPDLICDSDGLSNEQY